MHFSFFVTVVSLLFEKVCLFLLQATSFRLAVQCDKELHCFYVTLFAHTDLQRNEPRQDQIRPPNVTAHVECWKGFLLPSFS